MNKHDNKLKGNYGEEKAVEFLCGRGFNIISRNFSCVFGEVDIIAVKGENLHFVEVKSRTGDFIRGRYAVNYAKQRHIKNTATQYLVQSGILNKYFISFDVIEITDGEIEFLQNCFY
jgi:putative endonuclease